MPDGDVAVGLRDRARAPTRRRSPVRSCQTPTSAGAAARHGTAPCRDRERARVRRPPAGRRHGRRRPARPDDPPGRDRARAVAAGARRRPGRPRRAGLRRRACRRSRPTWRRCARSPAGCAAVTFDHEQVPQEHLRALVDAGVAVHPAPDALLHAQDKLVMRRAAGRRSGCRCRAFAEVRRRRPTSRGSPPSTAGRWCSRPSAAATTGAACGCCDGPDPDAGRRAARRPAPRCIVEQRGADAPGAGRAGRALAVRPGRGVAGGARPCRRDGQCVQVLAPAPGLTADAALAAQRAGAADRRRAGRDRAARRRAVRDATDGAAGGQRAGDAPAQLRALDDRGRPHLAVRAAPAGGAGLPARRHRRRPRRPW